MFYSFDSRWGSGPVKVPFETWIELGPGSLSYYSVFKVFYDDQPAPYSAIPTLYRNSFITRRLVGMGVFEDPWLDQPSNRYHLFKRVESYSEEYEHKITFDMRGQSKAIHGFFTPAFYENVSIDFTLPPLWSAGGFNLSPYESSVLISDNPDVIKLPVEYQAENLLACLFIGDGLLVPYLTTEFLELGEDAAELLTLEIETTGRNRIRSLMYRWKAKPLAISIMLIELPVKMEDLARERPINGFAGFMVSVMGEDKIDQYKDSLLDVARSLKLRLPV